MPVQTNTYTAKDGKPIFYYHWSPNDTSSIKGIVQIAHGMGEHTKRYAHFAEYLNKEGFEVYGNDHRGHGKTEKYENRGYTEAGSFWEKAISDMRELNLLIQKEHPNKPILLFAHSMGSILSRDYITRFGNELSGLLLSGTVSYRAHIAQPGLFVTKGLEIINGRTSKSNFLKSLFFDDFNRKFYPNRTKFDWISRDKDEVDTFVTDHLRTEDFSVGLFVDILKGLKKVSFEPIFKQTPKDLPIFIFSGTHDPAGDMGKGIIKIYKALKKAGHKDVTLKLYEEGRHEMLNEINKDEVYTDIINWIKELEYV